METFYQQQWRLYQVSQAACVNVLRKREPIREPIANWSGHDTGFSIRDRNHKRNALAIIGRRKSFRHSISARIMQRDLPKPWDRAPLYGPLIGYDIP